MANILKNSRVYLAGNLEHSDNPDSWREKVHRELSPLSIKILDPTKKVFENQVLETKEDREHLKYLREQGYLGAVREYMMGVVQKDLRQIDLSDFVIFNIEVEKPTFGTNHELIVSIQQKKPIFVAVGDLKKIPLWFLGIIKPQYFYNNVDEIIQKIKSIDSGETVIDSDRWRLLNQELR